MLYVKYAICVLSIIHDSLAWYDTSDYCICWSYSTLMICSQILNFLAVFTLDGMGLVCYPYHGLGVLSDTVTLPGHIQS